VAVNVLASVVGKKEAIENAALPLRVAREIERSAVPALYIDTAEIAKKLVSRLLKVAAEDAIPLAETAGVNGALPILRALEETTLTARGAWPRGMILKWLQRRENLTLRILRDKLEAETGYLSGELRGWFRESERGQQTRRELIEAAVASDKAELKAIADAREKVVAAQKKAGEIRSQLAADPENAELADSLNDATKEIKAAERAIPKRVGFLGRLEAKAQAHFRDAIRRTGEDAQHAAFVQKGYEEFVWIAVNGTDACPDCEARHGRHQTSQAWAGDMPGDGGTVCKSSCMCHLIPAAYAKDNASLTKPLTMKAGPSGNPPGQPTN
jgi:hypothetical protein